MVEPLCQKGKRRRFFKDSKVFQFYLSHRTATLLRGVKVFEEVGDHAIMYIQPPHRANISKSKTLGQPMQLLGPSGVRTLRSPEWTGTFYTPSRSPNSQTSGSPGSPSLHRACPLDGLGPRSRDIPSRQPGPRGPKPRLPGVVCVLLLRLV